MIKLERAPCPDYLTESMVKELTQIYKDTGTSVWNRDQIKMPLSASSSDKCAYCETDLKHPSTYMEVEHFLPKSYHEDLVVNWENLLPSCKRCNGVKSDDDIKAKPIVNPYDVDPRSEFVFDMYCIFGSTELGENTEATLELNDEDLFLSRCRVANKARQELMDIWKDIKDLVKLTGHRRKKLRAVLLSTQPNRPYSAFVSTIVHNSKDYALIKDLFIQHKIWTTELEDLHITSLELALPLRR